MFYLLPQEPSPLLSYSFISLSLVMLGLLVWKTESMLVRVGAIVWALLTAWIAQSGWMAHFGHTPPRAAIVMIATFALIGVVGLTRISDSLVRLPYQWLIGFQAFRILVEVLIHLAVAEGIAPPQLSWNGWNFDIITGLAAIPIALIAHRLGDSLIFVWNTIGLGLVLWVVGVAIFSLPTRMQAFETPNVWVAHFPFVWLPTILVFIAILGHVIVYRKIFQRENSESLGETED